MFKKHILISSAAILFISGCVKNASEVKQTQFSMGSTVEICVVDADLDETAKSNAITKAFQRMKEIEALMSLYDPKSEISKINNFAYMRPIPASEDTIKVIERADELSRITKGAIDITIAPLVELWGFGPKGAISKMPTDIEIDNALKSTGMDKIKIDYARKTIRFMSSGAKIDLGSIAPGYAVDCAIDVLKESGVKNAMVNAGGEVFCMGRGPAGRAWKIGIQHPRLANKLLAKVRLQDRAISTSGDYEKFFFWRDKRISHIIDPRTGRPVSNMPASVSITAPDCITADALSTAIFVLGPKDGMEVLKKMRCVEGMISVDENGNIKVYTTDGFFKKK